MNYSKKLLLLTLLGLFLTSCLSGPDQQDPANQLILTLEFTNLNNEIVMQEDTVNITTLRFLYGRTTLQSANDTLLVNNNTLQVTHQQTNNETKGLANGTFSSNELYNTLAFEIKQAEQSGTGSGDNFDTDAFIEGESDDQRYSMIINGFYNGEEFEFKSTRNFDFVFPIEDDSGGNTGSLLYSVPLHTNVEQWFLNEAADSLLNPAEATNAAAINDNIQQSFIVN